jgi:hypothetical protein
MKKIVKNVVIFFILGSLLALGYVIYKNGLITEISGDAETARERNLDWLKDIRGYSDSDAPEEETEAATSTEEGIDQSATSTEQGTDAEDEMNVEDADMVTAAEKGEDEESRRRSVENLGSADALESTEYDHAFDKLILSAELRSGGVALEWNHTESERFEAYKVVRSTGDENPYSPKTPAIKTLSNIESTTYFDSGVEPGTDYYYRICYTKDRGRPSCGNILKVRY